MPTNRRAYPEASAPVASSVRPLSAELAVLELVDAHGRRANVAVIRDAGAWLPGAALPEALQAALDARHPWVAPSDRGCILDTLVSG